MNGEAMNERLMRYWSTQNSPIREPKMVRFLRNTFMYAGSFMIVSAIAWSLEIKEGKRLAYI